MAKLPVITEGTMDTREDKLHKDLLIFACGFMNLSVALWLGLYWLMGLHYPANVPLGYQLISVASLVYYLKTKRFEPFRFVQLSLFLFSPFMMQWSIDRKSTRLNSSHANISY